MPTLLSCMGLEIPSEVEGKDRMKEIKGEESLDDGSLMMCTGRTAAWGDGNEWRAIRTKKYTYAIYKADYSELLFDNENDPYQMENLIGNPIYDEVHSSLKAMMYKKMEEIGDDFESNSYYRENWCNGRDILPYLKRREK